MFGQQMQFGHRSTICTSPKC